MFVQTELRKIIFILLSALMLTGLPLSPAQASPRYTIVASSGISLSDAVKIVRDKTGGHILSAKKVNSAEPIYLIKVLLPTGQVKSYRVSVETGKLL